MGIKKMLHCTLYLCKYQGISLDIVPDASLKSFITSDCNRAQNHNHLVRK